MKQLGLNQSSLARRMNCSRAYISKALSGDVNLSFSSACRFARSLEMDFLPGLAPTKNKIAKIHSTFVFLLASAAQAARIPERLLDEYRFDVRGSSNYKLGPVGRIPTNV